MQSHRQSPSFNGCVRTRALSGGRHHIRFVPVRGSWFVRAGPFGFHGADDVPDSAVVTRHRPIGSGLFPAFSRQHGSQRFRKSGRFLVAHHLERGQRLVFETLEHFETQFKPYHQPGLSSTDEFRHLDRDIEASPKRWRKIIESEFPERERLPQDWKSKSQLRQLCILRALRPDRVSHALCLFIEEKLGSRYVESLSVELAQVVEEMGPSTPLCFILSPGVNPLLEVEILARSKYSPISSFDNINSTLNDSGQGRTEDNGRIHLVSLGQGQEASANFLLNKSAQEGHWVILQNIHLVKKWLPTLERMLERFATTAHSEFKVFMSVQPPGPKSSNVVPQVNTFRSENLFNI